MSITPFAPVNESRVFSMGGDHGDGNHLNFAWRNLDGFHEPWGYEKTPCTVK
jgi:hypothetical protein